MIPINVRAFEGLNCVRKIVLLRIFECQHSDSDKLSKPGCNSSSPFRQHSKLRTYF